MLSEFGKPGDAVHFRGVEQVLVEIGLIDEDLIDAQLLEGQRIVLPLAVGALLELGDEALLGFLQFLDQPPVVVLPGFGLEDRRLQLLNLFLNKALEQLVRHRQKLERAVRDDHGVIVAAGDPGHRPLPVAGRKMLPARR